MIMEGRLVLVLELVLMVVLVNGIADDFSEMKVQAKYMNSEIYNFESQ